MCLEKDNLLFTSIPQHYGITKIKKITFANFPKETGCLFDLCNENGGRTEQDACIYQRAEATIQTLPEMQRKAT